MKIPITSLERTADRHSIGVGLANEFRNRLDILGCFLVTGCFDPHFIDAVHSSLGKLFSVSDSVKASCKVDKQNDPLAEGFSPYGAAHALDTGIANLLETWDISASRNNWPDHLSNEWQLLIDYQRRLYDVAVAALELIAVALEIKTEELLSLIRPENGGIHLIHYFPLTKEFPHTARRQSEHCDNTLITLIPPPHPTSTGISVFNREREAWENILIAKDECLIQAGLLLERITFHAIRANLHTVRNPSLESPQNVSRYSTPFFLSPGRNVFLKVLPKFRSEAALEKYADKKVGDIQADYFSRIFGKG